MIMAIAVIVILGTIMALSLALNSQTAKRTTDVYLYEQAAILAKSAAEYSLLRIAEGGPCSHHNDLNFQHNGIYNISITNRYLYVLNPDGTTACDSLGEAQSNFQANTGYVNNPSPDTNGTVIMDIAVSVTDPTITSEPIRYFRRTIQKL